MKQNILMNGYDFSVFLLVKLIETKFYSNNYLRISASLSVFYFIFIDNNFPPLLSKYISFLQ